MSKETTKTSFKIRAKDYQKLSILKAKKGTTIKDIVKSQIKQFTENDYYISKTKYEKHHISFNLERGLYNKFISKIENINDKFDYVTKKAIKEELINYLLSLDSTDYDKLKKPVKDIDYNLKTIKFEVNLDTYKEAIKLCNEGRTSRYNEEINYNLLWNFINDFVDADKKIITDDRFEEFLERSSLTIELPKELHEDFTNKLEKKGKDATIKNIGEAIVRKYIKENQ